MLPDWVLTALIVAGVGGGHIDAGRPSVVQAGQMTVSGHVALMADALPERDVVELRPEVLIDLAGDPGAAGGVRFGVEARGQALLADRGGRITDAALRIRDAWIEAGGSRGDVRAGYGRVIWGRLDEIQPSDVINPIDAARFLLDGRSAARLPIAFLRGRVFVSERLTIEGVVVPAFRRGTFDELGEDTSPFNLVNDAVLPAILANDGRVEHVEPAVRWSNMAGGGRVSATIGRVDVAGAVYRGFEAFGPIQFLLDPASLPGPAVAGRLVERHTPFTMVSGDFEAVAGDWALRGEAAAFTEKYFSGLSRPGIVRGGAIDAGAGFDRSTGDYRVFGSVLIRRQWSAEDAAIAATDVSLIGSIERQFARERYHARAFAVVNPADRAGFLRGVFTWRVRDDVSVDASGAIFLGRGDDLLSRFTGRDFVFTRITRHF